jgi:hypothetical protein
VGGVHTGSTRRVGHFWPIVPAPDDCEDGEFGGMKIGRGNRSTRKKTYPSTVLSTTNPTLSDPGANPGRRGGKPETNRLSYDAAFLIAMAAACPMIEMQPSSRETSS